MFCIQSGSRVKKFGNRYSSQPFVSRGPVGRKRQVQNRCYRLFTRSDAHLRVRDKVKHKGLELGTNYRYFIELLDNNSVH